MPQVFYECFDCGYETLSFENARSHGEMENHQIETVIEGETGLEKAGRFN